MAALLPQGAAVRPLLIRIFDALIGFNLIKNRL